MESGIGDMFQVLIKIIMIIVKLNININKIFFPRVWGFFLNWST